MAKIGRPKILDDDLIDSWCEAIATGLTPRLVCYRLGIDYGGSCKWLSKGEEDIANDEDTIEARFFSRHARAKAERAGRWLEAIAAGDNRDLRWMLEHCEPEEYGGKSRVELTGKDGGAVKTELSGFVAFIPPRKSADDWTAEHAVKPDGD